MSFTLNIETDMPAIEHPVLMNRFEQEGAKVTNISSCLQDNECFEDEDANKIKNLIAFKGNHITLVLPPFWKVADFYERTFMNEKGSLTAKELMDVIIEFEKVSRNRTEWRGGIDAHHIFFEGMEKLSSEKYYIIWGS